LHPFIIISNCCPHVSWLIFPFALPEILTHIFPHQTSHMLQASLSPALKSWGLPPPLGLTPAYTSPKLSHSYLHIYSCTSLSSSKHPLPTISPEPAARLSRMPAVSETDRGRIVYPSNVC
jgi:hypothetical protein